MEMQNPFDTAAFNMTSLTEAMNLLPNRYNRIGATGLFRESGVTTRTVTIEEVNGVLNLLPTQPVGSPGTVNKRGKRTLRNLTIPHIPHDDVILPQEYQGIRAFGSTQLETLSNIMAGKLQNMRDKHEITLEWLRMGALKGEILDADGSTIYNLFTEFGITQVTSFTNAKAAQKKNLYIDMDLGTAGTDMKKKCLDIARHIEANLMGEVMTGIEVLVDSNFFDNFTDHANVIRAYEQHQEAADRLGGDQRKGFHFGGLTFSEYGGVATQANGTVRPFIDSNQGHAYPVGTVDSFKTVFAPGDFIETANTVGLPVYAKQEPRKYNRGVDVHTQSNPLPYCTRPGMLVELWSST